MKTYEITEEQIKKIYNGGGLILKEWFPEVFETKLEIGRWYKNKEEKENIIFITDKEGLSIKCYGFNFINEWMQESFRESYGVNYVLATDSEVLEALKNEAVKRGLNYGTYINDIYNGNDKEIITSSKYDYEEVPYGKYKGKKALRDSSGNILFVDGIWAIPIKTYTKKEAEKMLNAKIV